MDDDLDQEYFDLFFGNARWDRYLEEKKRIKEEIEEEDKTDGIQ